MSAIPSLGRCAPLKRTGYPAECKPGYSGPNRTKDRFRRTFIGHYIDEASEQVSKFYHPVLNMRGEVVSGLAEATQGGPCGLGFAEPA